MRQVLAHNHGDVPFLFQQDSAPAHRAKKQEFLKKGVNFWPPYLRNGLQTVWISTPWTLPFGQWSSIQQGACQDRPESVAAQKRRIFEFWIRRKCAPPAANLGLDFFVRQV